MEKNKRQDKFFVASEPQISFFKTVEAAAKLNLVMVSSPGFSCNAEGKIKLHRIHWEAGSDWYEGDEDVVTREIEVNSKGDNKETSFHFHVRWPQVRWARIVPVNLMLAGQWYRIAFYEEKNDKAQMLFGFYTQEPEIFQQFLILEKDKGWHPLDPPTDNPTLKIE